MGYATFIDKNIETTHPRFSLPFERENEGQNVDDSL